MPPGIGRSGQVGEHGRGYLRLYYPIARLPQGWVLAPVAAWLRLPGSGGSRPLNTLDRLATLVSPRSLPPGRAYVRPSVLECTAPVTAVTAVTGVTVGTVVCCSEGGAGHVSHGRIGGAGARPVTAIMAPVTAATAPITTVTVAKPARGATQQRERGAAPSARREKSHGEHGASHGSHCAGTAVTALMLARTREPGEPILNFLFLSKTVADCLKLSQSSKIVAMCLNLSLMLSHVPAPKAHTSQGTIHGYVHSWNDPAQPDPPCPLLQHHPARSCHTTRPAPACRALPSQLHPARHAGRPGPPCPPTRPAVPADPAHRARRPGPSCLLTRPAKPANPPSRADQPGHVRCFGRDAVDLASLVSSSFLLISAS